MRPLIRPMSSRVLMVKCVASSMVILSRSGRSGAKRSGVDRRLKAASGSHRTTNVPEWVTHEIVAGHTCGGCLVRRGRLRVYWHSAQVFMNDQSSVTLQEFRAALGRFASGVTVITVEIGTGDVHGMTASSFCSVSLRPPLVLVCIDHLAETYLHVRERGRFGVSILKENQEALSEFFADPERNPDAARRLDIRYSQMKSGMPVVAETLTNLDCTVVQSHAAGDHTIFVAEVKEVMVAEGSPLLYFRGRYGACRSAPER